MLSLSQLPIFIAILFSVFLTATTYPTDKDPARSAEIQKTYRLLVGEDVGETQYTPLPTKKEVKENQKERDIAISNIKRYAQKRLDTKQS